MNTKPKSTHTPGPWFVGQNEDGDRVIVDDPNGGIIIATRMSEADAEFIVRAVNAHEELLNQVKLLETAVRRYASGLDTPSYMLSLCKNAQAAIAKAEGK